MSELVLYHSSLTEDIKIPEEKYLTFVIEDKSLFYKFLNELNELIMGINLEDSFKLICNGNALSIEKTVLGLFNIFELDFNSKKIMNLIIKKLGKFLTESESLERKFKIETEVTKLLHDFICYTNIDLAFEAVINETLIAKIGDIKVSSISTSPLHRICKYIDIIAELLPIKLVVFPFAKEFFNPDELFDLSKYCRDKGCALVVLENKLNTPKSINEDIFIIDRDLCCIF